MSERAIKQLGQTCDRERGGRLGRAHGIDIEVFRGDAQLLFWRPQYKVEGKAHRFPIEHSTVLLIVAAKEHHAQEYKSETYFTAPRQPQTFSLALHHLNPLLGATTSWDVQGV
jgi:hypothetical protein